MALLEYFDFDLPSFLLSNKIIEKSGPSRPSADLVVAFAKVALKFVFLLPQVLGLSLSPSVTANLLFDTSI